MKRVLVKTAAVVAVSYVTWIFTSSLLAQQAKKTEPKAIESKATVPKTIIEVDTPLPKGAKPTTPVARFAIPKYNVSVDGDKAIVEAVAKMEDHRGKMSYLWRLEVLTPDMKVISRRDYREQVFSIPTTGISEPTFSETVAIPQGKSEVKLQLYAFVKGTDLKFLDDDEASAGYESGSSSRPVARD